MTRRRQLRIDQRRRWGRRSIPSAALLVAGGWAALTRACSADVGWGRVHRRLGPITRTIAAPPDTVFDVVAQPYLGRQTRAVAAKLDVLERADGLVIAAHHTPIAGGRLHATTVESVRFVDRRRVEFRLLRGPVPEVSETFLLEATPGGGTTFAYDGTLGADLWVIGRMWGRLVARTWERTVASSVEALAAEAERRARHGVSIDTAGPGSGSS